MNIAFGEQNTQQRYLEATPLPFFCPPLFLPFHFFALPFFLPFHFFAPPPLCVFASLRESGFRVSRPLRSRR